MLWVGGGEMWGETYLFSMCILEEMQWKRTKAVTSAELFHGTLELVEKDTCVFLIKGTGACRQLDERAQRFLEQHTNKLTVIDPAPLYGGAGALRLAAGPPVCVHPAGGPAGSTYGEIHRPRSGFQAVLQAV